jgi:hypothetical protein
MSACIQSQLRQAISDVIVNGAGFVSMARPIARRVRFNRVAQSPLSGLLWLLTAVLSVSRPSGPLSAVFFPLGEASSNNTVDVWANFSGRLLLSLVP